MGNGRADRNSLNELQTHQEYDLFISHKSEDNDMAEKVYEVVKELYGNDYNIFLDIKRSLYQGSPNYEDEIYKALRASKKLIFVASKEEYCARDGWLFKEVDYFRCLMENSRETGFNEEYFGIFLEDVKKDNLENCFLKFQIVTEKTIDDITTDTVVYLLEHKYHPDKRYQQGERVGINRSILLDKTAEYAKRKQEYNKFFSKESINDELIPNLLGSDKKKYHFEELTQLLVERNIILIGEQGGSGKTSILTKLFYYYLEKANNDEYFENTYVPIYVDLNTLSAVADNHFVERYLLRDFFNETQSMEQKQLSVRAQLIENEFNANVERPSYLLILDGYNEIPRETIENFKMEFQKWLSWSNVRIILSSRTYDKESINSSGLEYLTVDRLSEETIKNYIEKHDKSYELISFNKKLLDILSIPMYLDIYIKSGVSNDIKTKGDLLIEFLNRQEEKEKFIQEYSSSEANKNRFCLKYILPTMAFYMVVNKNQCSDISESEMSEFLRDILDENSDFLGSENTLVSDLYFEHYDKDDISTDMIEKDFYSATRLKSRNRDKFVINYLLNVCGLIRRNSQNNFEFIHDNYRDFLCALFVAREMNIIKGKTKYIPIGLTKAFFDSDVISFISDILHEEDKIPFCEEESQCWNYVCNQESSTYQILNCFRNSENAEAPANIIEILKYARKGDLSNGDYSKLNLTKTSLNGSIFYRFFDEKKYVSSFEGATINKENLILDGHFGNMNAACLHDNILAVFDDTKTIILWDITTKNKVPVQSIDNVCYDIKKMVFSPEANEIIAISNYDIVRVDLDCGTCTSIFTSKQFLRDVFVDDGNIKYTTLLNPFNKKVINSNEQPDTCEFWGFSCSGAKNDANNQLAIGHCCGYFCLKIYDYDSQKKKWLDKKVDICNDKILSIDYLPNRNIIVFTANREKMVYKYDVDNSQVLKKFQVPSGNILYSFCQDGKIVIVQSQKIYVLNEELDVIFEIKKFENNIAALIQEENKSNVFVGIGNMFYEFDFQLNCLKSLKLPYSRMVLGRKFGEDTKSFINKYSVVPINNGVYYKNNVDLMVTDVPQVRIYGKIGFKKNKNILIALDTSLNKVIARAKIYYGLIVNECNFKNIRGSLSEKDNIDILHQYGAET